MIVDINFENPDVNVDIENPDVDVEITEAFDVEILAVPGPAGPPVEDGSLTVAQFSDTLKLQTVKDYVTPQMFGAKGDGVNNDTNGIKAAIESEANVVIFPEGEYLVNNNLPLKSNLKILGQGNATVRWNSIINTGSTFYIGGQSIENVILENITFDFGTLSDLRYGLSILDSENIFIKDCTFLNCYGYATRFNGCSNLHIVGCHFADITGGNGNPGGAIYGSDFHDVFITECSCSNIGDHFAYCAGATDIHNVVISDCNISTTGVNGLTNGAGIVLYANTYDVTITNCNFKQTRQGIYVGQYGDYQTNPHDVSIDNCVFDHMTTIAIELYGISSSLFVYRVNVSNCTINEASSDGILARHCYRLNFNNIHMDRPYRYGIEISDVQQSTFSNIVISGIRDVGIYVSNPTYRPDSSYNIYNNIVLTLRSSGATSGNIGFYHRGGAYSIATNIIATGFNTNFIKNGYLSNFNFNKFDENRSIMFTSNIAEAIYHRVGDVVFNVNPTSGQPALWVCTVAGSPGTMTPVATI